MPSERLSGWLGRIACGGTNAACAFKGEPKTHKDGFEHSSAWSGQFACLFRRIAEMGRQYVRSASLPSARLGEAWGCRSHLSGLRHTVPENGRVSRNGRIPSELHERTYPKVLR